MAVLAPLLLVPLLHARNRRNRAAAELSARILTEIQALPSGRPFVLEDNHGERPNLREAFGTLLAARGETRRRGSGGEAVGCIDCGPWA